MSRLSDLVQTVLQTLVSFRNGSYRSSANRPWEEPRCTSVAPAATPGDARARQILALTLGILLGILVSAFSSQ